MYRKKRHIHFVGIGGVGMSGIAEVLLNLGHTVSGSDLKDSDNVKRLKYMGAQCYIGHLGENIKNADVVVISSAVSEDNPEVLAARKDFIPVIPRAEMLAELMRLKSSVAVAGSHGKTTTTSILGSLLTQAGLDPTLVIGGRLNNLGTNARLGQGDFLVAEADESDGSFLMLSPTMAVVTNIDLEHLNYYRDLDHLKETFLTFINKVPFYGAAILCLDDPNVQSLLPRVKKRYISYGLSAQAEVSARNIIAEKWGSSFDLIQNGHKVERLEINLPGTHNVLNALAAAAVGLEMGLTPQKIFEGVKSMKGVGRRFEKKGEANGVTIIDDYGHHPTEIKATLEALTACFPRQKRIVVFQPHRYSRTNELFEEFVHSFNQSDQLIVTEIFHANEKPIDGVSGKALAQAISRHGHRDVIYHDSLDTLPQFLVDTLKEGDVLITLGAGSIGRVGEDFLNILEGQNN